MKRTLLLSGAAALVALFGVPATASAHGHHHYAKYVNYNGVLVDANDQGDDENDDDVVSVAEPAYYAPVQSSYYTAMPTQYVPVNDTIVTPYGYTPQYNNGYYQGYAYNPVYSNNPYYAGATYGGDPVAATVVNTLVSAAANGGHVDSSTIVQSLLTGLVASQMQQQQPYYGQPQPYYQPQYVQQYQPVQVYQQPQPVYVQQVIQRQYVPQAVIVPQQVIRVRGDGERHGDRGEHRGDGGGHGDHGGD